MKKLIGALIVIALIVALVSLLNQNNGYALLGFGRWTVEGSLALFILLDLLLFVLLYLAIRTLARVWSIPERWRAWKNRRQNQRAQNSLSNGLLDLAAGKWKSAEQKLIKYADVSDKPILNYLGAAHSAQERGALGKRDSYLKLAMESMPSEDLAVSLTQAKLQLSTDQMEQALATLMHLRKIAPKHGYVLRLLKEVYLRLEDWSALKGLLPDMSKSDSIPKDEFKEIEKNVFVGMMQQASGDAEKLNSIWKQVPKQLRSNADIVESYISRVETDGKDDKVVRLLEDAIDKSWNENLVELYGFIESQNSARQLKTAESWLKDHENSSVLLLALANICLRSKLWGKARSYLEACIGIIPTAEAHLELGILLEQMGEKDLALQNYRVGLELSSDGPEFRAWEYDGRKVKDDNDGLISSSDLRQPLDAPIPAAGESS
jgi:HemY protein